MLGYLDPFYARAGGGAGRWVYARPRDRRSGFSQPAPATAETHKLMDAARIAQMKAGSYLLNLARLAGG